MGIANLCFSAVIPTLVFLWGCVSTDLPELSVDVVATVNGTPVDADLYFRSLAALAVQEKGPALTAKHRQQVLDELVDATLLLAHARQTGMAYSEVAPQKVPEWVRTQVVSQEPIPAPSEGQLRDFYLENPGLFATNASYQVEAVFFAGEDGVARAESAWGDLAGGVRFEDLVADKMRPDVPDGPLKANALRQYIGPSAAKAVVELDPRGVTAPTAYAGGYLLVRLVTMEPGAPMAFEEVQTSVERLYIREEQQRIGGAFVGELRKLAAILVNESVRDAAIPAPHLLAALRREPKVHGGDVR